MHEWLAMKSRSAFVAALALACTLGACSARYDWREVRGANAAFSVLLPDKPSTQTRTVDLSGMAVSMTMTAAQVDGIVFAVGTAQLASDAAAQSALPWVKKALLNNIHASVSEDKIVSIGKLTGTEVEARGTQSLHGRVVPVRLVVRLLARDRQIYQVLVIGEEKAIPADAIDMFMSSFKLN
jgi:hypothetical protein